MLAPAIRLEAQVEGVGPVSQDRGTKRAGRLSRHERSSDIRDRSAATRPPRKVRVRPIPSGRAGPASSSPSSDGAARWCRARNAERVRINSGSTAWLSAHQVTRQTVTRTDIRVLLVAITVTVVR